MVQNIPEPAVVWWLRQIFLTLVGVLFFCFGIFVLVDAYRMKDSYSFVITFFAANFIILISGTLSFGFLCRIKEFMKKSNNS